MKRCRIEKDGRMGQEGVSLVEKGTRGFFRGCQWNSSSVGGGV